MNETDMIPHIIEIFWIEKLRFTQYCFNQIGRIPASEYSLTSKTKPKSISWAMEQMAAFDRNFAFYLPVSVRLTSLFFFPTFKEADVEKDIEKIRDKFTPPAFPLHFLDIIIGSAKELSIPKSDEKRAELMSHFKETLIHLENRLSQFSDKEAFNVRYISITGIHTISGAINNSTEYCHNLWNDHVAPYLKTEL